MKGLFRKKAQNQQLSSEMPTKPVPPESGHSNPSTDSEPPAGSVEPALLAVGCCQSVGKQRDHNEDALFTLTTSLSDSSSPFGLYIVADGMGGHQHGEVASNLAVRSLATHIVSKLYTPLLNPKPSSPVESLQEIMQNGVQDAHRAIMKQVPGGGTTLTAALVIGNQATIAHVGDSRAYMIAADGRMETLTRDHSLVKRLVELGQITLEEAAVHPQRNVLYRALGQGDPFEPDIHSVRLPESGFLFICSDGLWGEVPEEEIKRLILTTASPQEASEKLVEAANEAGGRDNITAILVHLPS